MVLSSPQSSNIFETLKSQLFLASASLTNILQFLNKLITNFNVLINLEITGFSLNTSNHILKFSTPCLIFATKTGI